VPEDKHSLEDDIKNFAKLVETAKGLIVDKVPVFQRNTLLRGIGRDLGLVLNETAIFGIVGKARREIEGTFDGFVPDEKIEINNYEDLWNWSIDTSTSTFRCFNDFLS
jgi:hypothetical protein